MGKMLGDLHVGAKVKDPNSRYYGECLGWVVIGKNHDGAPSQSTTIMTEGVVSYKAFACGYVPSDWVGATVPSAPKITNTSYWDWWGYSNIRTWLNSELEGLAWYEPAYARDNPPASDHTYNYYVEEAGFLSGFSQDFKNALLDTTNYTVIGDISSSRSYVKNARLESTTEKIFLLSITEIFNKNNGMAEGTQYSYFNGAEYRKAKYTQSCVDSATRDIESKAVDGYLGYYTRSHSNSSESYKSLTSVSYSGSEDMMIPYCYAGNGIRPACNLPYNTTVSDEPDSDGYYTLLWGETPVPPVEASLSISRKSAISSFRKPISANIFVDRVMPENAMFKVEVCNNGLDDSPNWEDCTQSVINGTTYTFSNSQKTSSNWGFNFKVSADRQGTTGDCFVSKVYGNFTR